ncbi:MAG: prephenate dehydratase domain-containing protein [Heliobacteriaceae bacterium]|nr:prephenate dehydratase domain-containing protein [Heliobacteriaceae bacterium]MDD4587736.1 prephenate dehydratase domain-containing protein [Heliobacteriaceae bacterium]
MKRIGYLGPRGTFSEEAASRYRAETPGALVACSSWEEIFNQVAAGSLDVGVVPVENSISGAIKPVLDLFTGAVDLTACGEVLVPVNQALLVRPGVNLAQITKIFSHQHAFIQCRRFLQEHLPEAAWVATISTAAAAKLIGRGKEPWAALGPARAAAVYGLQVLIPVANDFPENITRFWVVTQAKQVIRTKN